MIQKLVVRNEVQVVKDQIQVLEYKNEQLDSKIDMLVDTNKEIYTMMKVLSETVENMNRNNSSYQCQCQYRLDTSFMSNSLSFIE